MYSSKTVLPSDFAKIDVTELIDPVSVVHGGRVILFARLRGQPAGSLYYNIRLDSLGGVDYTSDWSGWRELSLVDVDGQKLLRLAGMDIITVSPAAEVADPADAPFRVAADQRLLYLFRQSTNGTLYVNRLMLVEEPQQPDLDVQQTQSRQGYRLEFLWEVRYRRSRKKDAPAGENDSLGNRDMDGQPFYEPTLELTAVSKIRGGDFAAVLAPTTAVEVGRWHFFVRDPGDTKVTAYSFAQSSGGLFDFATARTAPFDITPCLTMAEGPPRAAICTAGPAATICYEQEPADNNVADQTFKRAARLILSVPAGVLSVGLPTASFIYDFGLRRDGTIAAFDGGAGSLLLDGTISGDGFHPNRDPGAGYLVPDAAIHTVGDSTVAAVVLGQAAASAVPAFLDSGDGLVHYYFAGTVNPQQPPAFLVAHYSPIKTRFTISHDWIAGSHHGKIEFVAERTGSSMNGMTVTITDSGDGHEQDLCDIEVNYGAEADIASESWKGVPRALMAAVAVLNGTASPDAQSPGVRAGQTVYFDYSGTRRMVRLPLDDASSPNGHVSLMSRRGDIQLQSASVGAGSSSLINLDVAFKVGTNDIAWAWGDVPDDADAFSTTVRGDASPRTYDYDLPADNTQIITLQTSGGAILLLAAPGTLSANASITIETDGFEEEKLCKVEIDTGGGTPIELLNVPRKQSEFINALNASSQVSAIFLHISADPVSGLVPDQISSLGDLRDAALAFLIVDQNEGGTVVPLQAPIAAAILQGHATNPAQLDPVNRLLAATAVSLTRPDDGAVALLQNGRGFPGEPARNGMWKWQEQPKDLTLEGQNAMRVPLDATRSIVLSPGRYFTVESWVCPSTSNPTRAVCYNNGGAATDGGVVPSYMLGTTGRPTITFGPSSDNAPYAGSYIQIVANSIFVPRDAFTWSGWIRPAANPAPSNNTGLLFTLASVVFPDAPTLMLGLNNERQLVFGYRDNQTKAQLIKTSTTVGADMWSYVAVTGRQAPDKSWNITLYINAVAESERSGLYFDDSLEAPLCFIGTSAISDRSLAGSMSEVRFWRTCRSQAEIQRTMYMTLSGTESGLTGYWPLTEDPTNGATIHNRAAATGTALYGIVHRQDSEQPVSRTTDGTFLSIIAGIGGVPAVIGYGFLVSGQWNHIAAVFEAGTAIYLNPDQSFLQGRLDYANCGNAKELNLSNSGSLEALVLIPGSARRNKTIMAKWGSSEEDQSYKLYIDADKRLVFTVVLEVPVYDPDDHSKIIRYEPESFTVTSGVPLDEHHHHVVGTYKIETQVDNANVTKARGVLTAFIDGVETGVTTTDWYRYASTISIRSSDADFTIGMLKLQTGETPSVAIESQEYFQGVLTGVRVWTDALDVPAIARVAGRNLSDSEGGLVAAWWFGEQSGRNAADSIASNHARLSSSVLWVLYRPLGRVTCYANGYAVGIYDPASAAEAVGYDDGLVQFTAGAYIDNTIYKAGFLGALQELRLWNTARTVEHFRENMFRSLTGRERNLVGYWPFNGNTEDATVYGNSGILVGTPVPVFMPSTAPVSNEAPAVKNVYSDHTTMLQEPIEGTPSVVEYGDTKREVDGTLTAIQDRDYFYVNQTLAIMPDFKVGDLDLVYIGQVQTSPMLIGYIEGAPPVPSENLSRPLYTSPFAYNGYFDATSITLTQAEKKSFSFASSDYNTTQMQNLSGAVGAFGNWKVGTNKGSPFFSVNTTDFTNVVKFGAKLQLEHVESQTESQSVASGWTDVIRDRFSLRGAWEAEQSDSANYLNPQVGRRFEPDNIGYALVESLTADLYSMQLASTRQMVGKVVVPNADIPPDKNIITFRIDPTYVKNGTLDGKVGLYDDPDWTGTDNHRGSYFKPEEAYALKDQITRETAVLKSYYEQFDASQRGRSQETSLDDASTEQFYDWSAQVARKGLVNSYVWTASGGLHCDEQQVDASRASSYNGTYNLKFAAGPAFSMEMAFYIGVYASLDLLFGFQTNVTVTKSETESESFGMTAVVNGEPFLMAWEPDAGGGGTYSTAPCPGKVDAYRFMTFYLAPSTANADSFLDQVVDENWMRHSADPNAIALRGAVIKGNKVWRILHRVTYVSRIPPSSDTAPSQRVSKKINQSIVVSDNQRLLALVLQALGPSKPTPANVGAAVTAVLAPATGRALLSAEVPWWQEFVERSRGGTDVDAEKEMARLRLDTLNYMLKGYELGLLPFGQMSVDKASLAPKIRTPLTSAGAPTRKHRRMRSDRRCVVPE